MLVILAFFSLPVCAVSFLVNSDGERCLVMRDTSYYFHGDSVTIVARRDTVFPDRDVPEDGIRQIDSIWTIKQTLLDGVSVNNILKTK